MQEVDAVGGFRGWMQEVDAGGGCRGWMQGGGCRGWMQDVDAGGGCRRWMQGVDAGGGCRGVDAGGVQVDPPRLVASLGDRRRENRPRGAPRRPRGDLGDPPPNLGEPRLKKNSTHTRPHKFCSRIRAGNSIFPPVTSNLFDLCMVSPKTRFRLGKNRSTS